MIQKDFPTGKFFITDAGFEHVGAGQADFPERFSKQFGLKPQHIVWMNQTHSPTINWLEAIVEDSTIIPSCDGLITTQKNVMLITKTADCVPILVWHTDSPFIAVLHCGWKGFFKGIIESFLRTVDHTHLKKEGFQVFLGPHIRKESLSFKQNVIDIIPDAKKKFLSMKDSLGYYDLAKGVTETFKDFGIMNIQDCGVNTYTDFDYFSYRRWMHTKAELRPEHYNTFASCIILS